MSQKRAKTPYEALTENPILQGKYEKLYFATERVKELKSNQREIARQITEAEEQVNAAQTDYNETYSRIYTEAAGKPPGNKHD